MSNLTRPDEPKHLVEPGSMTWSAHRADGRPLVSPRRVVLYALAWALGLRLILSFIGAWSLERPIVLSTYMRAQYLGTRPVHAALLAPWQRFDTLWYMRIALHGYSRLDNSAAYFPLYPAIVRLVQFICGGDALLAALLVSFLCCCGLLAVLYLFAQQRYGERVAQRTVLFLLLFPTASFLLAGYTESLFLLLSVSLFLAADKGKLSIAALLGFLAALTRGQGIVLVLPLAAYAWSFWRRRERSLWALVFALAPALGTALFELYLYIVVHTSVIDTYAHHIKQPIYMPWTTLGTYWFPIVAHHWRLFSYGTGNWVDLLNIVLSLTTLLLVLPARRLLGMELWLYAVTSWCVLMTLHQSTDRYMLSVFPLFIVLALRLPRSRWTIRLSLILGAPLMLFIASEFVRWSLVG